MSNDQGDVGDQLALARDAYRVGWWASEEAGAFGLDGVAEAAKRVLAGAEADISRLEYEATCRRDGAEMHAVNVLDQLEAELADMITDHPSAAKRRLLAGLLVEMRHALWVIHRKGHI